LIAEEKDIFDNSKLNFYILNQKKKHLLNNQNFDFQPFIISSAHVYCPAIYIQGWWWIFLFIVAELKLAKESSVDLVEPFN
jgi:hypothetical protein